MAGPMGGGGGGGMQRALLEQMMRKQQTQDTLNSPGAVGGIGQQQEQTGPMGQTLSAVGSMGGPIGSAAASAYNGVAGMVNDGMNAPGNAFKALGRSVQGMGPKLANTIQGGPGAGLQSALMNAMNAGKPGIGAPETPKQETAEGAASGTKEEAGEMHAPASGLPASLASPMGQAMMGRQVAPDASLGSSMGQAMKGGASAGTPPQGTIPGAAAPGQPFRSEDFAAPVGPPMNKQRRRPGII